MQVTTLKGYLAESDISVKDFSKTLQITPAHLYSIMRGTARPSRYLAKEIKELTGNVINLASGK